MIIYFQNVIGIYEKERVVLYRNKLFNRGQTLPTLIELTKKDWDHFNFMFQQFEKSRLYTRCNIENVVEVKEFYSVGDFITEVKERAEKREKGWYLLEEGGQDYLEGLGTNEKKKADKYYKAMSGYSKTKNADLVPIILDLLPFACEKELSGDLILCD